MGIKEFLKSSQEVAFRTIENSFSRNQVPHAYLLSGSPSSPLKAMAVFLAQSILCENKTPLACEECNTCKRIATGSYIDFTLIDGDLGSIKKGDIEDLQRDFSKTALEIAGKKIYVIHLLEKASLGAVNSILKFLEEPNNDIVGIITTQNLSKILPTIISRCQLIRLKNQDKTFLVEELKNEGLSFEDAMLLAQNNATLSEALEIYKDENYHTLKRLAIDCFQKFVLNEDSINYYVQKEIAPKIKSRQELVVYLQILESLFRDVVNQNSEDKVVFTNHKEYFLKWNSKKDLRCILESVIYVKGSLDSYVNVRLALDRLFYEITKC